ncbi:MAG: beta-ketoacyl-ACP synthase II [Saprospiraceae bacterium]|nr:beta-ketoacyl-ACP synthase II [Saprospiraceae bacterium]
MALPRVVVTGIGALTPIGNTAEEFWKNLCSGESGAGPITHFDASKFKTQFACEVKDFVPTDFIEKREVRRMDPYAQYAVVAADEAIKDASLEDIDPDRVGVIWAAGIGGLITFHNEVMNFANGDGTPRFNPFFIPKMIPDIAAGMISMRHGFRGPNLATVSACASSTHAISMAFDQIRLGKADVMVTGGSEAAVSVPGIGGFNAMKALSERNDSPKTASRPFDAERDGFVLGEGAAGLILESLEHAQARGAKIYAEIVGTGLTADAHHITAPHPEGLGAKNVMLMALKEAKMQPEDIDYINVHGTSTPLGDIAEIKAIKAVFGESAYNLNISSTKSMTGHLLGAAGAIEALAIVKSVQEDIVPPTINHFTDDPNIDEKLNLTFNKAQKRSVKAALSNTFGFGGHNASLIVRKY